MVTYVISAMLFFKNRLHQLRIEMYTRYTAIHMWRQALNEISHLANLDGS